MRTIDGDALRGLVCVGPLPFVDRYLPLLTCCV